MKKLLSLTLAASLTVPLVACQSQTDPLTGRQQVNNTAAGAGLGALTGAVAGLLIAKDKSGGDQRKAALIGAGIGALVGGGIGNYMDQQEAELRQQLASSGVSVTRQGEYIILNMPGNITFATNSADINAGFFDVLNSVVLVLKEFDKTLIDVYGHTDSVGADAYNQTLSERRAASVGQYLIGQGVDGRRVYTQGFGETSPVASNDTDAGRQQNRRVELQLAPLTQ